MRLRAIGSLIKPTAIKLIEAMPAIKQQLPSLTPDVRAIVPFSSCAF